MHLCKYPCSFFCRPLFHIAAGIWIIFIIIMIPASQVFSKTISFQELNTLVIRIENTAEKQIIATHGLQTMASIRVLLQKRYQLNALPFLLPGGPCPAIGYEEDDQGSTLEAKALDQSGVYYIFGTTALLKNHLLIAEWGFAKASRMNSGCPAYLSNLGFILNAHKAFDDAITVLNYAKDLDPADSSIYVNLSYSYRELHRYTQAINEMMIAVSLQPGLKPYIKMLEDLKKLQKEERPFRAIISLPKNSAKGIDMALDLLEEKKQEENEQETRFAVGPTFPAAGSGRTQRDWQSGVIDMIQGYDTSAFSGDNACGYFKQQAHLLVRMGDGMVEKAGVAIPGGNPIEKFISTGLTHIQKRDKATAKIDSGSYKTRLDLIKDFASIGALETANIFYGIAGEMYEMCGEIEPDPDMDKFLDDLINERQQWNKDFFKNLDKEKFSRPVCTYKICISKGNQGSIKLSVSEGLTGVDIQLHPTNIYKYGFKVSVGGDLAKKTIGSVGSGSISYNHYFEWKFGRGMSQGTELGIGGAAGKLFSTKVGKSISLTKYSFEN